jgi:hypothetical protein
MTYFVRANTGESVGAPISGWRGTVTLTESTEIPAEYVGYLVIVDSPFETTITLPDAASLFALNGPPIWIYRAGDGVVNLASPDTMIPASPMIRTQGGTIMVLAKSATETICVHDGTAVQPEGTIWFTGA